MKKLPLAPSAALEKFCRVQENTEPQMSSAAAPKPKKKPVLVYPSHYNSHIAA